MGVIRRVAFIPTRTLPPTPHPRSSNSVLRNPREVHHSASSYTCIHPAGAAVHTPEAAQQSAETRKKTYVLLTSCFFFCPSQTSLSHGRSTKSSKMRPTTTKNAFPFQCPESPSVKTTLVFAGGASGHALSTGTTCQTVPLHGADELPASSSDDRRRRPP